MPFYNVEITLDFTMVVQADNKEHALTIANDDWKEAMEDCGNRLDTHVTGEVTSEKHLHDGWDGMCLPYGGDGNTRLRDLLTPNSKLRSGGE